MELSTSMGCTTGHRLFSLRLGERVQKIAARPVYRAAIFGFLNSEFLILNS